MTPLFLFIVFIIFIALVFEFLNGFHDAANSIATIVSTRVLSPTWAVIWAASFNAIAFLFFETKVAETLGTGFVETSLVDPIFILASLLGASTWNILTWYYGIPASSSHALIGGLIGCALIKTGSFSTALHLSGILKVVLAIFLSPLFGGLIGILFMLLAIRLFFHATRQKIDTIFRKCQLISAALVSLGHGGNDAQKTMGIIALLLFSTGALGKDFYVPLWVVVTCYFVIGLGTFFGGWRIIRTMGTKITKLKPISGFCAETATAITLFTATHMGIPISTTHTITGAIIGVGIAHQKTSAIRWNLVKRIVWAWIITIPATALLSAFIWLVLSLYP